ncbi:MAG: oligosaccharide flippase family protein [Anaerolineae bacterium]|nr:oligosaccharide flippase family protein [Anaerolineae bacterium]
MSRFLRDSSVMFTGDMASTALSLLASIIIGRTLGDDNYGLVAIAITAVETVVQFMDVRTMEGLIKFMGEALALERPRDAVTYFYVALGIDALLMVITLVVVRLVAPLLVAASEYAGLLQPLALIYLFTVPFNMLESTFSAVLIIYQMYRLYTVKVILRGVVLVFCLGLLAGQGMAALAWGYVVAAAFDFGVAVIMAVGLMMRRLGPANLRGHGYREATRRFIPFAFHTSLMASLKAVGTNIDVLLLGALRPPAEAGFFKIARNAANLMGLPVAPMGTVIYPAINEAWAKDDLPRVKYLIRQFMQYSAAISVTLALGLIVAADFLVDITYGPDYAPVANIIRLLAVGVVIGNIARWMRPTVMAAGKPQLVSLSGVVGLVVQILAAPLLVWQFGALGSALESNLIVLTMVGVNVFYVLPRVGLWRRAKLKGEA